MSFEVPFSQAIAESGMPCVIIKRGSSGKWGGGPWLRQAVETASPCKRWENNQFWRRTASARNYFPTVRTALGKLHVAGLLARLDLAWSFPQFPPPRLLLLNIFIERIGDAEGETECRTDPPPPHLPDDPIFRVLSHSRTFRFCLSALFSICCNLIVAKQTDKNEGRKCGLSSFFSTI